MSTNQVRGRGEKEKLVTSVTSSRNGVHWSSCIFCNHFICTNPFGVMACVLTPCWMNAHTSRLPHSVEIQPEGVHIHKGNCCSDGTTFVAFDMVDAIEFHDSSYFSSCLSYSCCCHPAAGCHNGVVSAEGCFVLVKSDEGLPLAFTPANPGQCLDDFQLTPLSHKIKFVNCTEEDVRNFPVRDSSMDYCSIL